MFCQKRGRVIPFQHLKLNKWKFMQFSVMNLYGFDFNIVSIYDWKTCIKWKQWKHYWWTFNKRNTSNNLGHRKLHKFPFVYFIKNKTNSASCLNKKHASQALCILQYIFKLENVSMRIKDQVSDSNFQNFSSIDKKKLPIRCLC
jgi:hypothetical protein